MNLDTGIKPNESYDRARENVNIGSGNLNIQIPLVHLPGRNGHDFTLALTYNSQNWTPVASLVTPGPLPPADYDHIYIAWQYPTENDGLRVGSTGWQFNIPELYATVVVTPPPICGNLPCGGGNSYSQSSCVTGFYLVMGDGSKYQFPNAAMGCYEIETTCTVPVGSCEFHTYVAPSSDDLIDYDYEKGKSPEPDMGQGVMLDLTGASSGSGTAVARFRDGSQIRFPLTNWGSYSEGPIGTPASALVDSNGNVISISPNGSEITDTLGRTITFGPWGIQYKDSNGQLRTIALNLSNFPTSTHPTFTSPASGAGGIENVNSTFIDNMLSSIVLPDGLSYTFQYNIYGEIVKIIYPSGGYTRYAYQAFPVNQYEWTTDVDGFADNREVVDKYECPAVAAAAGSTTPSGYIGSSAQDTCPVAELHTHYGRPATKVNPVTVIDPAGNQTIYSFGTCSIASIPSYPYQSVVNAGFGTSDVETSRQVYQGTSAVLQTVATTYQGCLKTSQTVTLSNGFTSETTWSYDTALDQYPVTFNDRNYNKEYLLLVGTDNLLDEKQYGFGPGSPGPLQRQTSYTYLATNPVNNINYQQYFLYILNRETSKTVKDGSGNQIAQTTYEYDNYRGGIVASGAVQHGTSWSPYDTTYKTRGNVTAITQWVGNGVPPLTTVNYRFDDTGNILLRQDTLGNPTAFSYADSWSNGFCAPLSGSTDAYVSRVTNALGQQTAYNWNSCTGTLGSITDPNNNPTQFKYDVMDRRVQVSYPDTGEVCLQYSDAQNSYCPSISEGIFPLEITETSAMDNQGKVEVSSTLLDGLSRVVHTTDAAENNVDTIYDSVGNIRSVSNPYLTTSDPTYGITTYSYDALRRKETQTQSDETNALKWIYTGNTIDYYDETGRHWKRTYDALGRLAEVLEPDSSNNPTIETDYQYDGNGNLTRVDQWGGPKGSGGDRVRIFSYDGLSRLISATNPETGTITYSYQTSGGSLCSGDPRNVCFKTDARGVKTTYGYDALNRELSKRSADGAATPTACYQYDQSSQASPNANLIGRLANEWTQSANANNSTCATTMPTSGTTLLTSKSILSYDPMGRIKTEQTCVYPTCTTNIAQYPMAYTYDLVGNITSYKNGNDSILYTNSYDGAGRLSKVESTLTGPKYPSPLFSNSTYSPAGGLTGAIYGTGTGIALCRWYDNRLRITGETDTSGPVSGGSACSAEQPQ